MMKKEKGKIQQQAKAYWQLSNNERFAEPPTFITCRPDSRLVAIFALFAGSMGAYGSKELAGVVVSAFLFTPFLILAGC